MPASLDLVVDLDKLGPHPFRDGLSLQPEAPALVLPAVVREAQEIERLWLPVASGRTIPDGVAPELDEPGFVGMQLKTELREPLSKIDKELFGVRLVLEPADKVSGRGESHPPALSEPDVNVSAHPAPTVQPSGRTPTRQ
jgi:hypothetical protein